MKTFAIFLAFLLITVTFGTAAYFYTKHEIAKNISSYEECAEAGYPILDSYPPQCAVPGDKMFVQNIGNELQLTDLITISNPRPNQKITSPVEIRGKARGTWFFEASFPIILVDTQGNVIAEGHATAAGDWMTEEFVPYKATLKFKTEAKNGTLVLMKDNPSGLPENDNQLEVPVYLK